MIDIATAAAHPLRHLSLLLSASPARMPLRELGVVVVAEPLVDSRTLARTRDLSETRNESGVVIGAMVDASAMLRQEAGEVSGERLAR